MKLRNTPTINTRRSKQIVLKPVPVSRLSTSKHISLITKSVHIFPKQSILPMNKSFHYPRREIGWWRDFVDDGEVLRGAMTGFRRRSGSLMLQKKES
jgi:hypothetical protein